jgi:hypothetical protein
LLASPDSFECFSKQWANEQLKVANEFLKEGFQSEKFWLWNQRLAAAIIIKTELQGRGWTWQAARINSQIHRFQAKINRSRPQDAVLLRPGVNGRGSGRNSSPFRSEGQGEPQGSPIRSRLQVHQGLTSEREREEASF